MAPPLARKWPGAIAAQLAVPVVLGLVIGGVIAFQAGSSNSGLYQVALGTPVQRDSFGEHPGVDDGHSRDEAAANVDCDIVVPAHPLTREGPGYSVSAHRHLREDGGGNRGAG